MENNSNKFIQEYEARIINPENALQKINYLKRLDLSKISDQDLSNLINSFFHIIPFTSGIIEANSLLFRARINKEKSHFCCIKDIYTPPACFITEYGRANKPGERIFYCASNLKLAVFEVLNAYYQKNDTPLEKINVTIGVWRLKMDLHVACIYDDPKLHTLRKDILDDYLSNQKLLFNGNISLNAAVSNSILLQFFAEEFTKASIKRDADYKLSNFYLSSLRQSNSFILEQFNSDKFDGLNYPSNAMKYKGDNQALFIESADTKLELINALELNCRNINFDILDFDPLIINESESIIEEKINWAFSK